MTAVKTVSKFITALGALSLIACSGGSGAEEGRSAYEREGDRAIGSPNAPVTLVEYASVACGGCAAWHQAAMPTVKSYIESGDVRFVLREMLTGQPNLAIAGFMLADCVAEDRYYDVIDVLFEQQRALFTGMQQGTAQSQFQAIARAAGLDDEAFRACMTDEEGLARVQERSQQSSNDGVGSTPTFFINGERLETVANPSGDGSAFAINGEALIDADGPIPATYQGEVFERIILYFKNGAEGSASADGNAG